jgi:selenocysteine lyase/cysteine desulfurase
LVAAQIIPCQRDKFDIPDEVAYLNCASLAPLSRAVQAAGDRGLDAKLHPWSLTPEDFFTESDAVRGLFARLIGAQPADIALVPSVSYGMAVAAKNLTLRPGRRVVVLAGQYPSNVYPWRDLARRNGGEVVTLPQPEAGDWTESVLAAIDERVDIVALPQMHWVDGRLIDLVAVGRRVRAVGAALVLDLTQSLGARPFDLKAVDPDFIACAGYKWLMGPYSFGYLYVAPRRQGGQPLEHGWITREGSRDFARLVDYRDGLLPGAVRFDVGERSNFALTPMARVALEQVLDWGVERIAASLATLTDAIVARTRPLGLEALPQGVRAGHYLGLRFPGGMPDGLVDRLAAANVHVSKRGDALRVTPHLYNTPADIDRFIAVLERAR